MILVSAGKEKEERYVPFMLSLSAFIKEFRLIDVILLLFIYKLPTWVRRGNDTVARAVSPCNEKSVGLYDGPVKICSVNCGPTE